MAHFSIKLVGVMTSMGILAFTPIAFAQETVDPLEGLGSSEDNAGGLFNDSSSLFDLVHEAVLANPVSAEEFQRRQHRNVNEAAAEFRQQRQEALSESGAVYSPPAAPNELAPQ